MDSHEESHELMRSFPSAVVDVWQPPVLACDPQLFSWEADGGARRSGGVADKRPAALAGLAEALRETGATCGTVRLCHLHPRRDDEYVYGSVVASATVDEASGVIVWEVGAPC
jgi:hypothetical protein